MQLHDWAVSSVPTLCPNGSWDATDLGRDRGQEVAQYERGTLTAWAKGEMIAAIHTRG